MKMVAKIFVSHSKKDNDIIKFFQGAFSSTNVKAIFEEIEGLKDFNEINKEKIRNDIDKSSAVFVLLSSNVNNLTHTRDWVCWETAIASEKNKDVWIFEPQEQLGHISVVTPSLRHYMIYSQTDDYLRYIIKIIESYDDSHILPTVLMSGIGALFGAVAVEDDRTGGASLGAVGGTALGLALNKPSERPMGISINCRNCSSIYSFHSLSTKKFRCPVCNLPLEFRPLKKISRV